MKDVLETTTTLNDLTSRDFFMRSSMIYDNEPRDNPHLKDEIQRVIREMEPPVCGRIVANVNDKQ